MKALQRILLLIGTVALVSFGTIKAIAAGLVPVIVEEQNLTAISVIIGSKNKNLFCFQSEPGNTKRRGAELQFVPLRYEISQLKKKIKLNPANTRLKSKQKQFKLLLKHAKPECSAIEFTPTPTPTVIPSGAPQTPGPVATPTFFPTPTLHPRAVFDYNGNVTTLGKQFLLIPSNLNANINAGADVDFLFSCAGCHARQTLLTYEHYLTRLPQDPMYFQIPETINYQQLADLTAFMNSARELVP